MPKLLIDNATIAAMPGQLAGWGLIDHGGIAIASWQDCVVRHGERNACSIKNNGRA